MPMFITDIRHYLNEKGVIAPEKGSARKMAEFITSVVAHASDFDRPDDAPGPPCVKCRMRHKPSVETAIADDEQIVWRCLACGSHGRISHWERTFWDLSQGMPSN